MCISSSNPFILSRLMMIEFWLICAKVYSTARSTSHKSRPIKTLLANDRNGGMSRLHRDREGLGRSLAVALARYFMHEECASVPCVRHAFAGRHLARKTGRKIPVRGAVLA